MIAIDRNLLTFEIIFQRVTLSDVVYAYLGDRRDFPFSLSTRFRVLPTRPCASSLHRSLHKKYFLYSDELSSRYVRSAPNGQRDLLLR